MHFRPSISFFRHVKGSGFKEGTPFGQHVLYNWWKRACDNLGIEGIDLYGGTRHSSAKALQGQFSPEQIKRSIMRSTSKAFERYYNMEADEVRGIYEAGNVLVTNCSPSQNIQVIDNRGK